MTVLVGATRDAKGRYKDHEEQIVIQFHIFPLRLK
jgi:hypothetical protein